MAGTENKNVFNCAGPGQELDRSPEKQAFRGSSGSSSLRDHRYPRPVHWASTLEPWELRTREQMAGPLSS